MMASLVVDAYMAEPETRLTAHRGDVYRYFCRAVGDDETARDLTQEVFLRAARRSDSGQIREERAWLFRVARKSLKNG